MYLNQRLKIPELERRGTMARLERRGKDKTAVANLELRLYMPLAE